MDHHERRVLTIIEFVERYNIGRTAAYAKIKADRLRAIKFGRSTRIAVDDAEAWLDQAKAASQRQGAE